MMNKVNIQDYIVKEWKQPEPVTPSQELVEKWKPLMELFVKSFQHYHYIDDAYAMIHAYMRKDLYNGKPVVVYPIEEKDYLEISANLEYLERMFYLNYNEELTNPLKNPEYYKERNKQERNRWIITDYRARLTENPFNESKESNG